MPRDLPSPRRSRRANGSSTTSKSPDAEEESGTNVRHNKRVKDEEDEEDEDQSIPHVAPPTRGGRRKRDRELAEPEPAPQDDGDDGGGDEEGTTRCLCDELEVDGGDFMVMCEQCSVWQHGVCMGFDSEADVPDEYFCEQCRPDLHHKAIQAWQAKRRERSGRQSSAPHHSNGHARHSRSHSPTVTMKQPSKRRNTMNSRDADFDEITKQILEESAAEAAAALEGHSPQLNGQENVDESTDDAPPPSAKRTRSDSAASEHPMSATGARGETPSSTIESRKQSVPIIGPPPKGHGGRGGKRGGARKAVVAEQRPTPEQEESDINTMPAPPAPPPKRGGWGGRGRGGNRKAPASHVTGNPTKGTAANGSTTQPGETPKANKHSHAYVISQQSLYTSWNLPDYLAHLQGILPSDSPAPLEVRSSGETEKSTERGVKVKWPGKRMSVIDMNKRVRSLVEWVGREQNNLRARESRRMALEEAVERDRLTSHSTPRRVNGHDPMAVDSTPATPAPLDVSSSKPSDLLPSTGSMKQMEELMEELLQFQDKYGRGRS
ncbi:hypothetical protein DL96DRAFT_1601270 [Flagelloscypha sp. PMI_526]|nr:hypothetical protein DL96DRAFT_1601270 [Flagelloscypha sp. PMI_526]